MYEAVGFPPFVMSEYREKGKLRDYLVQCVLNKYKSLNKFRSISEHRELLEKLLNY